MKKKLGNAKRAGDNAYQTKAKRIKHNFDEHADYIIRCFGFGYSNSEVANHIGADVKNLQLWIKENPDIQERIKYARTDLNIAVVNDLYDQVSGNKTYMDETITTIDDQGTKTVIKRKERSAPISAKKFWLTNMQSDVWKDDAERYTDEDKLDPQLAEKSNEDIQAEIERLQKELTDNE